ncbi:uroporphyrinogen decarboxylase family protein [Selenomonas sp. TAMA-11512]|uniref:uroporphyrinogen decarboxylase family protein n=1 Tax=Selenomonas sp. TAMA-11512 TaxID=3095337 RepID=UPI00308E2B91|nr:uroporphyrinogen decarboxylase family protein [Selenomonas sp. TAMA-11512]
MTISKKQLVLDAMDRKPVERIPSGFWFHFLDDEIGADAFRDPSLIEKVIAGETKYIEEFQPDFVKIMTDGYFHYQHPQVASARRISDLKGLRPLADDDPWFTEQIAYAKKLTSKYGSETAMFYNVFGAATTLRFMQPEWEKGEALIVSWIKEDKETLKAAFDVISGDLAKLARRIVTEGGATGIYFSVQNLIGDGITKDIYREVIAPGEKAVLAAVREVSDYSILHICGYAGHRNDLSWYQDYDVKTVNWAAVVEGIPMEEGRKLFPNHAVLGGFGNLTSEVLYRGSKEEIQAETRRILDAADRTGVLLGADCTVPRDIDWKHLEWVREAAR